ncbi:MAG: DHH family phosphoesterase [Candidatus Heimdallarchaeota archaeon]|nr:DHH family phosphoesterase [Candidatus Heimdallarchaeota archaeon]MBY8995331.1 DHH family phosphoesterase [Candidatus Heimdallarchaeota archaeon]
MSETIILCHGDCDGMTSGAIALAANPGARIWLTKPFNLDDDLKRIDQKYDKIIITDIALNEEDYNKTFQEMRRLRKLGSEIIYIDHHPLPEGIKKKDIPATITIHRLDGCAAELTYLHFEDKLSWEYRILAAIGAVGDYVMDSIFAQEVMNDYDGRSIAFQAAIIVQSLGEIPESDDMKMKKSIIERLALGILPSELNNLVDRAMRGSQIEKLVREYVHKNAKQKKFIGYILDIPTGGGFKGKGALFAATAMDKPVGICGNSIGEDISMSLRRRDENYDLNIAVRKAATEVGGSGGGHPSAAGARIKKTKWIKFLDLLDFELKKQE